MADPYTCRRTRNLQKHGHMEFVQKSEIVLLKHWNIEKLNYWTRLRYFSFESFFMHLRRIPRAYPWMNAILVTYKYLH